MTESIDHRRVPFTNALADYQSQWLDAVVTTGVSLDMAPQWVDATATANEIKDLLEVSIKVPNGSTASFVPLLPFRYQAFGFSCEAWQTLGDKLLAYHPTLLTTLSQRDCLTQTIRSLPESCGVLMIPSVVDSSDLDDAIKEFCRRSDWRYIAYPANASPYIEITANWEDFLAAKSKNFRYTLRRKSNGLEKSGEVSQRWFRSGGDIEDLLETIIAIERLSWKVSAGMAISHRNVEQEYYSRLLPFLVQQDALVANAIYLDRVPIAYSLCVAWNGTMAQLKTSFSEEFSKLSPGLVVNSLAIKYAFDNGFKEFDFLGDVMPHKTHWTSTTRRHNHYFLFRPALTPLMMYYGKQLIQVARRFGPKRETLGRGRYFRK